MASRRNVLTPEALAMVDVIARTGSFAAAARELGKVPSALTYSVRQLEDTLDVLLFDRRSRQAQLTAAGHELLIEGRRLLEQMDAVANRVRRVACGWESELTIIADDIVSQPILFDLVEGFDALRVEGTSDANDGKKTAAGTRLRLSTGVLAGTWEALVSGAADLAIGVAGDFVNPGGIELRKFGSLQMIFVVAPHHPLAQAEEPIAHGELIRHRAVAVADTAHRLTPVTVNLLPGQDVLTVPTMRAKLEAQLRGLGCGYVPEPLARPHLEAGRLVQRQTARASQPVTLHYAWQAERGPLGIGRGLQWWLQQLESPTTRAALIERHAGLVT